MNNGVNSSGVLGEKARQLEDRARQLAFLEGEDLTTLSCETLFEY